MLDIPLAQPAPRSEKSDAARAENKNQNHDASASDPEDFESVLLSGAGDPDQTEQNSADTPVLDVSATDQLPVESPEAEDVTPQEAEADAVTSEFVSETAEEILAPNPGKPASELAILQQADRSGQGAPAKTARVAAQHPGKGVQNVPDQANRPPETHPHSVAGQNIDPVSAVVKQVARSTVILDTLANTVNENTPVPVPGRTRADIVPSADPAVLRTNETTPPPAVLKGMAGLTVASEKSGKKTLPEAAPRAEPIAAERSIISGNRITTTEYAVSSPLQFTPEGSRSGQFMAASEDLLSLVGKEDAVMTQWESRTSQPGTLQQTISRAETPGLIGRQMAEALQRLPDQPVELALNPKELGRVRMTLAAADGAITLSILAERPETLDLMRRNIDELAREFRALGFDTINFAFSEGQQQTDHDGTHPSDIAPGTETTGSDEGNGTQTRPVRLVQQSGLDLRL